MDEKFTKQLGAWLESDKSDFNTGALLFLRATGKKIVFANMIANPSKYAPTLEYELNKIYKFRLAGITHEKVSELKQDADKRVREATSKDKQLGKRLDHDSLPENIQALYVENFSIIQRMRENQLEARRLSVANKVCPDSDIYPFVQEIIRLDKKRLKNWEIYDTYQNQQGS